MISCHARQLLLSQLACATSEIHVSWTRFCSRWWPRRTWATTFWTSSPPRDTPGPQPWPGPTPICWKHVKTLVATRSPPAQSKVPSLGPCHNSRAMDSKTRKNSCDFWSTECMTSWIVWLRSPHTASWNFRTWALKRRAKSGISITRHEIIQ